MRVHVKEGVKMPKKAELDFSPLPDEAAMARLSYSRWEQSEAETMAEYVTRRRTVDLAALVRQVIEEDLVGTEKQVVSLRFFENLMTHEIAQRLHMNKSSVSRALASAEEHIRQYLKYVVRYQYSMENVPFLPLAVREAMAVSAARYGKADAASKLRRLRMGEHLTLEKTAGAVGIEPGRLRDLENGGAVPDARELLRLASFYGVCVDSILKGEPSCKQH
jgi:AraC-like DNA-binding protein